MRKRSRRERQIGMKKRRKRQIREEEEEKFGVLRRRNYVQKSRGEGDNMRQ